MRRSSSKLIIRARSVAHMGKVPFKFKFNVVIETVDKIAASGDVVFVLERNNKLECTKPTKIDPTTRKVTFTNDKIGFEIALYKNQPSERKFLDKVFKLALKSGGPEGKTLGKIHLNFAEYAEVPSGSKRISAELTNGAILVAKIESIFISMGKVSNPKMGMDDVNGDGIDDEYDDLDAEAGDISKDRGEASANVKNRLVSRMSRTPSKKAISRNERRGKEQDETHSGGDTIEKLRKENNRLRKQIEELERSSGQNFAPGSDTSKLLEENRALKSELNDLKSTLTREPVYSDVVRELKETKMALALLHLEKEEYHLELMKFKKDISPVSR